MHCSLQNAFQCAVNSTCGADSGVPVYDTCTLPGNLGTLGLQLLSKALQYAYAIRSVRKLQTKASEKVLCNSCH